MKKSFLYIFLFAIIVIFWIYQNCMVFLYTNPYTNTETFGYIANSIKELDKIFKYSKNSVKADGYKIKYLYYNAYGSGFIKNNTIPNDLDFSVGIYIGKYKYDGKNKKEVAQKIIDAMNAFENSMIFCVNSSDNFYITESFLNSINEKSLKNQLWISNIEKDLDKALSENNYINYKQEELENNYIIKIPFSMKKEELLIHDRSMVKLYNDQMKYFPSMKLYEREISIVPEYYVDIEYNGKVQHIEIVTESARGNRLQLKRRLFASCIFAGSFSEKFLREMPYIKSDNDYMYYRFLSFRRHLQDINTLLDKNEKTPKIYKRLEQAVDMIAPMLEPKLYEEIMSYISENMNNPDIRLLNEYANVCGNIASMMNSPEMFYKMLEQGKIKDMYNVLDKTLQELYSRGNVSKQYLDVLTDFEEKTIKQILSLKSIKEVQDYNDETFDANYLKTHDNWINAMYSQYKHPEKVQEYMSLFDKKLSEAGIHTIDIYWLNLKTVGIVEDDFTKNIKDFDLFVKENDLINLNYKIIKPSEVPNKAVCTTIYVKYKMTQKEQDNYKKLQKKFLDDKKNFNIKRKYVIIKK